MVTARATRYDPEDQMIQGSLAIITILCSLSFTTCSRESSMEGDSTDELWMMTTETAQELERLPLLDK